MNKYKIQHFEAFSNDPIDNSDPMIKNIQQYISEWEDSYSSNMCAILFPNRTRVEVLKYNNRDFIEAIDDMIDTAKGNVIKKYFDIYERMLAKGHLHIVLEEVEDLFLDIPKYVINKNFSYDNQNIFNILVDIEDVSDSDLGTMCNHIFRTIKERLPDTLLIKRVTTLYKEDTQTYDIKIRLFPKVHKKPLIEYLDEDDDDGE